MYRTPTRFRRLGALSFISAALAAPALLAPAAAHAQVPCPNPVPVINENNCQGAGTSAWRLSNHSGFIAAFPDQPSVNLGSSVDLKIGRSGSGNAIVRVYRIGYYGGSGGRLVHTSPTVAVDNPLGCSTPDSTFGRSECSSWEVSYTVPGSALPTSGIYIAKVTDSSSGGETQAIFVVRDDARSAPVLFKLPTATYQAYNNFGGKSTYDYNSEGAVTVAGTDRAAKVSFDRPYANIMTQDNWFPKADYALVYWMERQGYDMAYSESTAIHATPSELLDHQALVITGHDEYWSQEELQGYLNARNAGVSVASFSSNTAYWKVRYENGGATLVSHKTVQGSGSTGSGSAGSNDWGPDGALGTADDALGLDGRALTADDRPASSTTTFRDNGAAQGDPNAPSGGRVGPNLPENTLFGSMYVGDNDSGNYQLTVPPANGSNEYAGDRIWRNTGIAAGSGATINSNQVGWEWDAIPSQAQYLAQQPAGVKRVTDTNVNNGSHWLQDEGRVYSTSPPPGQPGLVSAVKYSHSSGALVFSSGTNQWSWGLGPYWRQLQLGSQTYQDAPFNSADTRIAQATYNVFADMGVAPGTPTGIVLDGGNQPPDASFTVSPNPATVNQVVSFNGGASSDPGGSIAKYEWDLDGNGSFETDTGTTATTTRVYASAATVQVKLRVTDSGGLTAETTRSVVINEPGGSSAYADAIQATAGLTSYWRLGELTGTTLADSRGGNNATLSGGSLGAPGAITADSNTAVSFDGANNSASAPMNLSGTTKATVEFWLKWDAFANNDSLALEHTPNFNTTPGGILVDPNANQGTFGVGIGNGLSRNNAFFTRPSAGAWHHYALVLDSGAAPAAQVTPYVDGVAVPYTKSDSGTGAGNFANSVLYFMSRAGNSLFGAGDLDELAVYSDVLTPATIAAHYQTGSGNPPPANQSPTASFTATPNPALTDQPVTFNGSASSDPDGTIAKYEWDLDGNGTYETDSGTTASASRSYASAGNVTVGLRVTDNATATGTTTRTVVVNPPGGGGSPYADGVLATTGLQSYWRMGELSGATLADSRGGSHATVSGASLGAPGAITGDSNTAVSFDGANDSASAPLNLSATTQATVEFWLKWDAFGNDDDLALEHTPNFNSEPGGILVDPNASQGSFGIGIGNGLSRNNAFFSRPSAGAWHHYAIVLDSGAAAASQITPYVDGVAVPYSKLNSGTGAGNFANSVLHFMSRAGTGLFGAGDLDELAVYNQSLSAATIASHYGLGSGGAANQSPSASFTVSPSPAATGQQVSFNGAASSDPDGSITKYEWDLDGNGTYETDTATTASATRTYTAAGDVTVGLRVTDNASAVGTTTRTLTVSTANQGPSASFTAAPNPALTDQQVSFNGSASSDPDGSITKYEWDLDGNGSYETDTGATATTTRTYAAAGDVTVGLRVTDNATATGTTTRTVTVNAPSGGSGAYAQEILAQAGLVSYWRMGEATGNTLADIKSARHATVSGATLGAAGALAGDSNTAVSFDGADDFASAPLNLSGTSRATVEFWLKWDAFAGDDDLAFEHTPNFNSNAGGILVDPNANQSSFGIGIGTGASRNNAFFARPSAGAWHHYAIVLDSGAAAASQITPYVDGVAVSYTKADSGTGAGNFADSVLYFMSRAGANLFGAGDLDELAVYSDALGPAAVASHYATGSATPPPANQAPTASFAATPNPATTGQQVSANGSASSDPDGTITKYEWDLDGNGSYETDSGTTASASRTYTAAGNVTVGLRVTDNGGETATTTRSLSVQAPANQAPTASFTATPSPAATRQAVSFNGAASSDPDGTIARYEWDLDGNGSYETDTGATATASRTYTSVASVTVGLRVTDNGATTATTTRSLSVASAYAQAVLGTTGVRGYWRLADASTTAADASSSANNGVFLNGPLSVGPLIAGELNNNARDLDGANDWVDLAPGPFGTPAQLSAEAWVRTGSTKPAGGYHFLITNSSNEFANGFSLAVNQANQATFVAARTATARGLATSSVTLAPNTTHHVVGTYDGAQVRIYVDGVQRGSAAFTGALTWNSGRDLRLGRKVAAASAATAYLDGVLDEAAVYTTALPAATVLAHYNAGRP